MKNRAVWVYVALFFATVVGYEEVRNFSFVNYDDPFYVSGNPHVRQGLTGTTIGWAFTSGEGANWFPLTRLSWLVDSTLSGLDSGWFHFGNVLLHALASMLLFAFLHRATREMWPSAFVAAVFALHPLHVESVAWISERKDVLCAFFWMLSLWAYCASRRGLSLAAFALGLMAKPMIVTLPFLLLLVDWWPLGRKPSVREKLPYFALSAASAVVTFMVQQASGAVKTFAAIPFELRVENALVSYVVYIAKMFCPTGLAVFYPYPAEIPVWQPVLAAIVLAGVSWLLLGPLRAHRYLAVGWFWYVITVAPVIGIVQVGGQARADRYMYVPMVGLAIMLAWGARAFLSPYAVAIAAAACFILTWNQVQYWYDSGTLFQHAVDVTRNNGVAEHNLGTYLTEVPGRLSDALAHLKQAVRINPDSAPAHTDLGNALSKQRDGLKEAIAEYQAALHIDSQLAIPHNNLGMAFSRMPGGMPAAIGEFEEALRIDPEYTDARENLTKAKEANKSGEYDTGLSLAKMGNFAEAIPHFEAALRNDPGNAEAENNLGFALVNFPNRVPEAIRHFEAALRINPNYFDAHYNLGVALANSGRVGEAIKQFEAAERIRRDPEIEQLIRRLRGGG